MATLPITIRDIVTPFSLNSEENVTISTATNRTMVIGRSISSQWSLLLNLKPYRMQVYTQTPQPDYSSTPLTSDRFHAISSFLAREPVFKVPIYNNRPNELPPTPAVTLTAEVGERDVSVTFRTDFRVGQYIRFSGFNKMYQVAAINPTNITLTQALRQRVTAGTAIIYSETDYNGDAFNGVLCNFLNMDFGSVLHGIDNGVLGTIGPIKLREFL